MQHSRVVDQSKSRIQKLVFSGPSRGQSGYCFGVLRTQSHTRTLKTLTVVAALALAGSGCAMFKRAMGSAHGTITLQTL